MKSPLTKQNKRTRSQVTCLQQTGRLSERDRQKYYAFNFTLPPQTAQLWIHFRFRPGMVETVQNLLTLSLFDPVGFRGAAHRWQVDQKIRVAGELATPGFFSGPLYPGRWQVEIDAHEIVNDGEAHGWCEYELTVIAEVQDGQHSPDGGPPPFKDPRREAPGPAWIHSQPGWYKGDLHSHSLHCDGGSAVADMARAAANRGLDFLALTCHNTTSWFGVETQWPEGLVPMRGMECTTYFGHANTLGIEAWIDWRTPGQGFGTRMLLEQTRQQDALFVVNHPCAVGNPFCTGCHWDYMGVNFEQVDCLEVWNGLWRAQGVYNPAALRLWTDLLNAGYRITALAGTDNHQAGQYLERSLPFTWVYAEGLSEAEILQALRRGRVFLSAGPELYFTARTPGGFETCLPGDQLPAGQSISLVVDVRELAAPAALWLVSDGVPSESRSLAPPGGEVIFEGITPQRWCRLELRQGSDPDGELLALTNPLYQR